MSSKSKKNQPPAKKVPVIISTKATKAPEKQEPPAKSPAPPEPKAPPEDLEISNELAEEKPEQLAELGQDDDPRLHSRSSLERRARQRAAVLAARKAGTYP